MAEAFVPNEWTKTIVTDLKWPSLADHLERQRLGDEVGFGGEWDTVVFPDGTEFDSVEIVSLTPRVPLSVRGRKVVKREVPDEAAQDDFQTLLAKWRDEGKGEIADRVEDATDEYGYSVQTLMVDWVDEVVEREADVSACKFYRSLHGAFMRAFDGPTGAVEGLRSVALTEADYNKAAGFDVDDRSDG